MSHLLCTDQPPTVVDGGRAGGREGRRADDGVPTWPYKGPVGPLGACLGGGCGGCGGGMGCASGVRRGWYEGGGG